MMRFKSAAIAAAVLILPGSCIAGQLLSQNSAPAPKARPVLPRPAVSNAPTPAPGRPYRPPERNLMLGTFKLNRPPQQGTVAIGIAPPGTTRLVVNGQVVPVDRDGRFLLGFGRDHDATAVVVAFRADGSSVTERLPVAKRAWNIENLKTVRRYSQPDAEFQARRPGELAQINEARRRGVVSDGWRQDFIWPSRGRVSGKFGSQRIYAGEPGAPHSGIDVAVPTGTPVFAPANGVVTLAAAAPFTLEGNLLIIDHGMGLDSAFLHLSKIHVRKGDVVRQGQLVGAVGATGRASGPHLHWGMKWRQERIDPEPLAGPMVLPIMPFDPR